MINTSTHTWKWQEIIINKLISTQISTESQGTHYNEEKEEFKFTWYSANSTAIVLRVLSEGWSNLWASWDTIINKLIIKPQYIPIEFYLFLSASTERIHIENPYLLCCQDISSSFSLSSRKGSNANRGQHCVPHNTIIRKLRSIHSFNKSPNSLQRINDSLANANAHIKNALHAKWKDDINYQEISRAWHPNRNQKISLLDRLQFNN